MERPEAGWLAPKNRDPLLRWIPTSWRRGPRMWIVVGAVVWLPLLGLCLLVDTAIGPAVDRPFLREFGVHARYLLALPMLLMVGPLILPRFETVLQYFFDSEILSDEDQDILSGRIARMVAMRDAPAAQFILILVAFGVSAIIARGGLGDEFSSWSHGGPSLFLGLSPAGWWQAVISNPVWLYLLLRWGWRLVLWSNLLAVISRRDLRLIPTHPDRAGGLGMLEMGQMSNVFLVIANSIALAGDAADSMRFDAQTLPELAPTLVVYTIVCLIIAVGPLLRFTGKLRRARREGLAQYGDLGYELFRSFEEKWVPIAAREQRGLMGSADPSSLADYGYAYEVVGQMRLVPFGRRGVVFLAVAALAPFAPLALFKYSPLEIAQRLLGILG